MEKEEERKKEVFHIQHLSLVFIMRKIFFKAPMEAMEVN